MNTDTMNPQDTDTQNRHPDRHPAGTPQAAPGPSSRSATARTAPPSAGPSRTACVAGVAEGLARYFGIDVTIVRIAFAVLTVVGGAGIPLYLAGLLLIPDEGSDQSIASSIIESLQNRSR